MQPFRRLSVALHNLSRNLFSLLRTKESKIVIGIVFSAFTYYVKGCYERQQQIFQSALAQQVNNDKELLETLGGIISSEQDSPRSSDARKLKARFVALYYGQSLFFESCFFKSDHRVQLLRNMKETLDNYYAQNVTWEQSIEDIKRKTIHLSRAFSESYKPENRNECFF